MKEDIRTATTIEAVKRFHEAFNRHDVAAVMAAMTDDCVFANTAPREYWEKFFRNSPDAQFAAEEMIAIQDRCVVRWFYQKTLDGKPLHFRGVDIFRVRDGRVAETYIKG